MPKFEIGNITGDEPGEAQLFYERYCARCEEIAVPNSTPTEHFYLNEKSGVGLLVCGSGKTAAGLSLASREPCVCKGVVASADCYWKGWTDHKNAVYIAKSYGCSDEYAVTEMEDIAVYNAARCFGLEDRVIALRVVVNMDTFLEGDSPESLWLNDSTFSDRTTEKQSETRDIFEPGMHNLFDVGQLVIDDILA